MILSTLLQSGAAANSANSIATQAIQPEGLSFWTLMVQGGPIMIPIGMLSILAIYIFIERYLAVRRASKYEANFMNRIREYIHEGKIDTALTMCRQNETPIARMIEKGIERIGRPLNDVNKAIENVANLEIAKLEKNLPLLATVSGGAPMLGFLGTVVGMIDAFYKMSAAGNNLNIGLLSGGIYTAMVTTVGGLIVGIMAYFCYNILIAKIESLVYNMETNSMLFMDLLNEPVK
jgi:biopolymer transport protein ExbB